MKFLRHHWRLLGQHVGLLRSSINRSDRNFLTGIGYNVKRFYSQNTSSDSGVPWSCHLKNRSVISLRGKDTYEFLQGLVTNDVNNLSSMKSPVQYSFMLNVQGRVLYDLFLYKHSEGDSGDVAVLVDADVSVTDDLLKVLKFYKLRKKVAISNASDKFQVWAQNVSSDNSDSHGGVISGGHDPRVPSFGKRFIRNTEDSAVKDEHEIDEREYRKMRYKWGIPEGVADLPPGNCFPLESNAVFMNGVDFQKGCYIGQELTARTFHTGVTRKRIMPVAFECEPPIIDHDATIKTEKGRNAGKFRGSEGHHGLALVRLANIKDILSVSVRDETVALTAHVPDWWPEFEY